ncbi:MAG TPA: hypothetical protein VGV67_14910 [Solirubrobacteraceae bacterium]|nr:hypothetical protein [Solirubrobacteraceae bacterium]
MFEQPGDQQVDPTEEATTGDEGPAAEGSAGEESGEDTEQVAAAVDEQAQESSGSAAEGAPEVPDDASQTIAAAQEHIDSLNMDEQRSAAKKAT